MRLIAGTSDIFGKLPPGLPGSRFAVDQEMFGLDGRKHKKKTPVKAVEDHDEVPDVPSSSFVPPKPQRHSYDDDGGVFGLDGRKGRRATPEVLPDQVAAKYQQLPEAAPAHRLPGYSPEDGGEGMFGFGQDAASKPTNWVAIGVGVAIVAGIIALIMYNKKSPAAGGVGNVGKGESRKARKFISRQTKKLVKAGLSRTRAAAAAYNMARQKHFKVASKPC
jgi:hypothetical protein